MVRRSVHRSFWICVLLHFVFFIIIAMFQPSISICLVDAALRLMRTSYTHHSIVYRTNNVYCVLRDCNNQCESINIACSNMFHVVWDEHSNNKIQEIKPKQRTAYTIRSIRHRLRTFQRKYIYSILMELKKKQKMKI